LPDFTAGLRVTNFFTIFDFVHIERWDFVDLWLMWSLIMAFLVVISFTNIAGFGRYISEVNHTMAVQPK